MLNNVPAPRSSELSELGWARRWMGYSLLAHETLSRAAPEFWLRDGAARKAAP